jgi:hypothetical protein
MAQLPISPDRQTADNNSYRELLESLVERSIKSGKPPKHRKEWEAELADISPPNRRAKRKTMINGLVMQSSGLVMLITPMHPDSPWNTAPSLGVAVSVFFIIAGTRWLLRAIAARQNP